MRLCEHLGEEELQEAAVVPQPIPPVVLRPAFLGLELVFLRIDGSLGQRLSATLIVRANEDDRFTAKMR
jgi:hypothetical protein